MRDSCCRARARWLWRRLVPRYAGLRPLGSRAACAMLLYCWADAEIQGAVWVGVLGACWGRVQGREGRRRCGRGCLPVGLGR